MSLIKVNVPGIGEVDMSMTDEQMKQAILKAKEILKSQSAEDYVWTGGMATEPTPGGFTGEINKVDWDAYFPKVTLDEIKTLTEEALSYEEQIRLAATAAIIVLGSVINGYMKSGGTTPSVPDVEIPELPVE